MRRRGSGGGSGISRKYAYSLSDYTYRSHENGRPYQSFPCDHDVGCPVAFFAQHWICL